LLKEVVLVNAGIQFGLSGFRAGYFIKVLIYFEILII